jgi:hypothetical protein
VENPTFVNSISNNNFENIELFLTTEMVGSENIAGITIIDFEGNIVLAVGSDRRTFVNSHSIRAQTLKKNQFAALPASDIQGEQRFEILQYGNIGNSYIVLFSYYSNEIEMLFNHPEIQTLQKGKLVFICPLNNLLDQGFRGNLNEGGTGSPEIMRLAQNLENENNRNGTNIFTYEVGRITYHAHFNEINDTGWLLGIIENRS